MRPIYSFRVASISDMIQLAAFVTVAILISGLNEAKRRTDAAYHKVLEERIDLAQNAVRVLKALLPMCAWCRKIREQNGEWADLERYVERSSGSAFSHTICPDCQKQHYPAIQRTDS